MTNFLVLVLIQYDNMTYDLSVTRKSFFDWDRWPLKFEPTNPIVDWDQKERYQVAWGNGEYWYNIIIVTKLENRYNLLLNLNIFWIHAYSLFKKCS